jgi:hypothetical protein
VLHLAIDLVCAVAVVYGLCALCFALYLAVMAMRRAQGDGRLGWPPRVLGLPIVLCGLVVDVALNLVLASIVLLEWPRLTGPAPEWLLTTRLKRLVRTTGWRARVARWVCTHLLDAFDPSGCHCD